MAKTTANSITINISDEARLMTARTILGYESVLRGLTIGQTFEQLILSAVDLDSYPQEVKEHLAKIRASSRQGAIDDTLKISVR